MQSNPLKGADGDTPMKLKQPPKRKKRTKASSSKAEGTLSDHLADIQLKLDHIIDRIKDSLYQRNGRDHREDEKGIASISAAPSPIGPPLFMTGELFGFI